MMSLAFAAYLGVWWFEGRTDTTRGAVTACIPSETERISWYFWEGESFSGDFTDRTPVRKKREWLVAKK